MLKIWVILLSMDPWVWSLRDFISKSTYIERIGPQYRCIPREHSLHLFSGRNLKKDNSSAMGKNRLGLKPDQKNEKKTRFKTKFLHGVFVV